MIDKKTLEELYNRYNDRQHVHPDPLEFLYNYSDIREREVAGIIASSLAYGQVKQILKSVASVLDSLGPELSEYLCRVDLGELKKNFQTSSTDLQQEPSFLFFCTVLAGLLKNTVL